MVEDDRGPVEIAPQRVVVCPLRLVVVCPLRLALEKKRLGEGLAARAVGQQRIHVLQGATARSGSCRADSLVLSG